MRHLKYDKNCLYCNKQFTATRDDTKFCSNACRAAYRRKLKMSPGGQIQPAATPSYDYDKHFSLLPKEVQRAIHPAPDDFCPECNIGGGAHAYGCSHQDDEIKKGTGGQVTAEQPERNKQPSILSDLEIAEGKVRKLIQLLRAEVERKKHTV